MVPITKDGDAPPRVPGVTSVWYRRGLEIVRVFYPGLQMKDIERYIVGWWS